MGLLDSIVGALAGGLPRQGGGAILARQLGLRPEGELPEAGLDDLLGQLG